MEGCRWPQRLKKSVIKLAAHSTTGSDERVALILDFKAKAGRLV
jgi:hypothetical protein